MSDVMRIQPFATQLRRVLVEFERRRSIFDIPAKLFVTPTTSFGVPRLFGKTLATPIGPSAGPHTQLSQNIVSSWLCGGRFIELKTVQVKDDLVVPKPCIDMTDEGYNVEWSQELSLDKSAHEYVVAWALLHILPRVLGWDEGRSPAWAGPGAIFDMSVGYDLAGIRHPRMTRFMDVMADASEPLAGIRATLRREFPQFADIEIPSAIVNSVTLSTMHGCPSDEIERIARYCLEERGLHTVVKLNPTLLGKDVVRSLLHDDLGFGEIEIPDSVFDHDLKYDRAVELISALQEVGTKKRLTFGVKLSNTLAMSNQAGRLPGHETYMSGQALFPVTMRRYDRLLHQFDGDLHVSYSAGADGVNIATILSCGALPVTGCTDLLKPGGVARMTQWLETLGAAMRERDVTTLAELSRDRLANVHAAADEASNHPRYKKPAFPHGLPKVKSGLGLWDCVVAPCVEACAVEQDVPEYAWLIGQGEYDRALAVILARNPLPGVTGYVCTHLCQTLCTRNDYEESVAIRALKRIAEERGRAEYLSHRAPSAGRAVAIVGSGPSGLAAAAFLALNGVRPTIFEARDVPGGMIGGGDTAMDAVRTAQRFTGAPATLLYRRTRQEMPAAEEELKGVLEEGNILEELVAPIEILREGGHVVGVMCVRNTLGDPGPDGRRSPVPLPGSEFTVPCDTVVVAVGQLPELAFLDGSRVARHRGGGVLVDGTTRCAGPEGVYAGGDVVIEPGSIISACADGRAAAESICEHLSVPFAQSPWPRQVLSDDEIVDIKRVRARRIPQVKPAMLPVTGRNAFGLIESTFTNDEARAEGRRCVQCTAFCDKCVEVCPNRANYTFRITPVRWALPVLGAVDGGVGVVAADDFRLLQDRQIPNVDDISNEWGDCQTFCVHHGRPYADKPRFFLDADLFAAETSNAFRIEGDVIRRREQERDSRLTVRGDTLTYEDDALRVLLTRDWRVIEAVALSPFDGTRSLVSAAEMVVLFDGILATLPFLLIE